jgi:tetratricopeptide (TPR) repeat protein
MLLHPGARLRGAALGAAVAASLALVQGAALAQTPPAAQPAAAAVRWSEPSTWTDWSRWTSWWPWRGERKPAPPTGVQAPHYGDSLFYFFQGRYFTSVTSLMVSQHFGRMAPHDDEAEILRGGLFLSYGLHREAGEVFAKLIERGAPPPVRDRAWFYLAKIRYQRDLLPEAEDALGRIEKSLPGDLEEDRALLAANVLMARGKYAQAAAVLDTLAKAPGASSYVRFNLGVAAVRNGDAARGNALLDEIGKLPAASEEFRSLRDKANLALGFAALQGNRGEEARAYLERVRLNGMLSNKALLGFGWAAAAQGRMTAALVPWSELAKRDPSDAAVLEAKLAVPYAHAELGAYAQALSLYEEAIGAFGKETAALDESIAAIRGGRMIDGLLAANPGEEMGWFWNIAELPGGEALPHAGHLAQVLATHEFQEAFKNYRDLLFLARNLQQWRDSLAVLRDMLANRRQAFAERLPQVQEKERALRLSDREFTHDALTAELGRVEREVDVAAFATARERELQVRLDRVRGILARLPADEPELLLARERLRRVEGALRWQQNHEFPARLWNAKKGMQEMSRNLAQAQQRNVAIAVAQREEPARQEGFARRIDALEARVLAMQPRVAALTKEQQAAVQELAVAELTRQKERLAAYGTQARFAVAQIYDRANLSSKDGSRAAAQ